LRIIKETAFAAILLTALLRFGLTPAFAAADGVYLTETHTYYLNPDTGVTDDGGTKNAALGEGMCRSVVYEKALVEIDGGKIYATVRLQLMSNMRDFSLFVQDAPGGSYTKVSPRAAAEDAGEDTADYRFELPSLGAYMSWEMYVIPMGRDVKFYMNLSESLNEGSGDFAVSIKPKSNPQAAEAGQPGAADGSSQAGVAPAIATNPKSSGEVAGIPSPAGESATAQTDATAAGQTDATAAAGTGVPGGITETTQPASSESDQAMVAAVVPEDAPGQASGSGGSSGNAGANPVLIIAAALLIAAGGASLWVSMKRRKRA
jgi:hypothetical protein